MMTLWQTPAVVLTLVTWLTSPPANLAEVAQREALRRSMTPKSAASYSNENMRPDMFPVRIDAAAAAATSEVQATSGELTAAAATTTSAAATSEVQVQTTLVSNNLDEKAWRARMTQARAAVDRDQGLVEAMQSRINSLQNDVINRDDPAQQAALRQTLAKALGELERLKAQVVADQKAIADIQTEARKANVPPGWVR
jgi:hypothetical protein